MNSFSQWTQKEELAFVSVIIYGVTDEKNYSDEKMKVWTEHWLFRRNHFGFYNNLLAEFRLEEEEILIKKILTTHFNRPVHSQNCIMGTKDKNYRYGSNPS